MNILERIYEAAARVGFLKQCTWRPADGSPPRVNRVGLQAPDETLLDNLALSTETTMSYPAIIFDGLTAGERVEIDGVAFRVRETRAVGDGSEMRARLTRL